MFGISNAIAYGGQMVCDTPLQPSGVRDVLGGSKWFDVRGEVEEKWCRQETDWAAGLLSRLIAAGLTEPDIFFIAPFRVVAARLREALAGACRRDLQAGRRWAAEHAGTVHTFQGREAEAVVFVLGAAAPRLEGARNWAGYPPNLVNVAASRAKRALYVVGNHELWRGHGAFRTLAARLPVTRV